jgi:uncharacterized membrane protein
MALSYTWRWQVGGTERLSAQGLSLVEWWGYPMAYYIAWQGNLWPFQPSWQLT